ncbi:hypothetical protein [Actinomyces faecalis]|uniref:hypothetical protein n=1 Tax=Actinomyces faecalis TaxID=2722820 RepID=UPI0015559930|nr:hypothetical protein [Actinomyces faecalis]
MKQYQVRAFFIDKKDAPCPLTDRLTEKYKQPSGGYIEFAKECGIEDPSQYWHLIHSWAARSNADTPFTKRNQCGELIFWMAEVSGAVRESELVELLEEILQTPTDRRKWNGVIKKKCFDKIAEVVESAEV